MLAITGYDVLKFLHVLFAITWLGGGITITVLAEQARATKKPGGLADIAEKAHWMANRVFVPSSVLVFLLGLWLVHRGHWGYGHFWILYALVAYGVSFAVGAGFLGPQSGRIAKLIAAEGPEAPVTVRAINQILWVARADLLLLVSIVFMMVTKVGQ
jgi:uncharacterized membrane protein